jgi:hypothetical protein
MKSLLPLLLFFFINSSLLSQQDGRVLHYISKCKSCEIPIPGAQFDKVGLSLFLPDSLYSSGDISVKKIIKDSFRLKRVKYSFEKNIITYVFFTLPNEKQLINFLELDTKLASSRVDELKEKLNSEKKDLEIMISNYSFKANYVKGNWEVILSPILN